MPKIHVVDTHIHVNETIEYENDTEIEYIKIKKYHDIENTDPDSKILIKVVLENDEVLTYKDNGFKCFTDKNGTVYAPVYDVETCEKEGYSIYEADDIIGFTNRGYNYSDYI